METTALSLAGPLASNDPDLLIAAALDGAGLACVTEATVTDHLAAGRLVRVLDEWCPEFPGWQLYYSTNRHMAPALKALVAFLIEGPPTDRVSGYRRRICRICRPRPRRCEALTVSKGLFDSPSTCPF